MNEFLGVQGRVWIVVVVALGVLQIAALIATIVSCVHLGAIRSMMRGMIWPDAASEMKAKELARQAMQARQRDGEEWLSIVALALNELPRRHPAHPPLSQLLAEEADSPKLRRKRDHEIEGWLREILARRLY